MSDRIFDRETLLDLSVNVIPLAILLCFVLLFIFVSPFPADSLVLVVQMAIVGVIGVALFVLTYYSGKVISRDEKATNNYIPAGYSEADAEVSGVPGEESE
ncbi:uncharacterized protein Nmlp_3434 [Natronomonas moolapensis 8.8.11]|uniref:Cox cluster protein n=1 Tax=Natronomonas moolapensis (strain DSM 18674 / CECT 7526 / JCM 14361 / 8.8.11) TaxID=268739 RepID=M1XT53_NATM8|nr:DUF6684 family protein [Natronomonas moolapensis]CCQ37561.1 uncharacterized protein Nmlp_3434 [Natronomonas moolapensis 8.8.11]